MSMLHRNSKRRGFTVVELSVVMVVLGILAGIIIVSVNSWRTSVARKEVQSDLNGVVAGMNTARNFNNGYPLSLPSSFTSSPNVQLTYVSGDATGYCIDGKSKVTLYATYFIDTTRTGGQPMHGTCAIGVTPDDYDPSGPGWNTAIASGSGSHKCGISSGKAYCWGTNTKGQLGNNTLTSSNTPVAVDTTGALSGKTVSAIAVGAESTCAIANAEVYCWGNNVNLENGWNVLGASLPPLQRSSVPLAMNAIQPAGLLVGKTVTAIAGSAHTYCVIASGAVYCWGANFYGQLGVGDTGYYTAPVAVSTSGVLSGKTPTALSSIRDSTCAIASGQAYCWGNGNYGQLGRGSNGYSYVPVQVDTTGVLNGKTVTAIAGGYFNYCVVANAAAYCWGYGTSGQLGNGGSADSNIPVAVTTTGVLSGKAVTAITSGAHSCVIANGGVYCWGGGGSGQMGNGTTTGSNVPVAVDMSGALSGKTVTSIASGQSSMCAASYNEAYCWGLGPLGHGPAGNFSSPVKINAP